MYDYPSDDDQSYDPLGVNQPAYDPSRYDPSIRGDDMIGDDTPLDQLAHWHSAYMTVEDYIAQCFEMLVDPRSPRACLPGVSDQPTRNDGDQLFRTHQIASYLPYADFTLYNEVYHNNNDHDCCGTCYGKSGTLETDIEGDGVYATPVDRLNACDDCIGVALCPGCMQPLTLSFDQSAMPVEVQTVRYTNGAVDYTIDHYDRAIAAMPFDGFICLVCGWQYDADRFYDDGDDYDYDYDGGDYDDDPGFDPMFLM